MSGNRDLEWIAAPDTSALAREQLVAIFAAAGRETS